jgi:hypothetical protein
MNPMMPNPMAGLVPPGGMGMPPGMGMAPPMGVPPNDPMGMPQGQPSADPQVSMLLQLLLGGAMQGMSQVATDPMSLLMGQQAQQGPAPMGMSAPVM